ncbi:nitroreductase family deazaflavin-dependent oxidoreductase [Hoyosella rhizosphaerae]|uniref:Nitroreductase n=1 Tax=Hoyosella rhizosphaerae TaxID=1755582 RepID=A0A916U3W9_9ACTN|nr:nitroreductase/quinone reductase family protein [Hoyosella rhizosphaerae]MBN4926614.1 nitroreductase family deazaflavin-dependent oxidoreductase [Hoyosella rhizosphaerae]GGC57909.1 nitroreductase [Hoyosella rhizosphaerae]
MPNDRLLKAANTLHKALLKATGGRIGSSIGGMPVLELITVGRKSGQERRSMLTAPIHDNGEYVIVASRGGDPMHPAWYHNLVAQPDVDIIVDGTRMQMRARTTTGDERTELWSRIVKAFRGYADYQKRTTREIPVVVLTPR